MTIITNASNRKLLAEAISQETGVYVCYLGAPSFAYQVGPYTIDRDAAIHGDDLESLRDFLLRHEYIANDQPLRDAEDDPRRPRRLDSKAQGSATAGESTDVETALLDSGAAAGLAVTMTQHEQSVGFPIASFTPQAFVGILRTLYARQELLRLMLRTNALRIDEELISLLNEEKPDTVERISELLAKEIHAGLVIGVSLDDGVLRVSIPADESMRDAAITLLNAAVETAAAAHRVSARLITPAPGEEKYFCHSWLIQLGLRGPDFKAIRAALLGHLPGYAAFRSSDKMDAHKAKYSAKRKEARGAKAEAAVGCVLAASDSTTDPISDPSSSGEGLDNRIQS